MTSVARRVLRYSAITALCSFSVITHAQSSPAAAQLNVPVKSTAPAKQVDLNKYVNDLGRLSRTGDSAAIAELSQYVFSVVAVPAEVASGFHLTQRLAQAETDYRNGAQPAVHEADLVRAHNNLIHSLQLPEWASTSIDEMRKVQMGCTLAYPDLFADQASLDKDGRLSLLSENLSPAQAMFLETTLLYQKFHNPNNQLTESERAAGGVKTLSPLVLRERMNYMVPIADGKLDNIGIFDLNHAIDNLFSDLRMSNSLRSQFDKPYLLSSVTTGKEAK